ncbi:MAG TPA: serine/threonine-protein kinase [Polyangiaceae bacterium]|nr:serine/threonine-protein kinase [Polyangiaceae bacterium]
MPVEQSEENPMIGQLIGGRYRITGVLGEGGMGVVYVAEQQMGSTIRKVAVKTLHQHLSKDPSVLARFHRECGTVAQLEHPNTIKFYDFGATADGTLYIAMEFVAGKPLNQVIEANAVLPAERALKILRQICGALEEAHGQGIVHRDLKPENVILTDRAGEADFVKVLDFGIAARTESADAQREQKLTQQGMVLGTPPYMSPEQFTMQEVDHRSDIYSLGVMAYEMLTGKLPFEADTPWQWATQHMTAQPRPFEITAPSAIVPEGMRRAILRSLSKNRDDRQESARQFYADLAGGGQLTAEQGARAGGATGTAAMARAPDFSGEPYPGGVNPTAGMPSPNQYGPPPVAPAHAVAHAVPTPGRAKSGSGKGLVIGLAAAGAVLLIAIAIVVASSLKPEPEEALTNPLTTSSGVATIAPQIEVPEAGAVAAPEIDAGTTAVENSVPKPTSSPKTQTKPRVETPPKTVPGPSGAAACDACVSAAQSGSIQAAAGHFSRCDDAGKKQRCRGIALGKAPGLVQAAAFNGQCGQARAINAAARAMGSRDLLGSTGACK